MFKQVLQNDEEILFEEGVNQKAFIKKGLLSGIGLSAFISCFPAQFITIACAMITDGGKGIMIVWPISWAIIFVIGIILSFNININIRKELFKFSLILCVFYYII